MSQTDIRRFDRDLCNWTVREHRPRRTRPKRCEVSFSRRGQDRNNLSPEDHHCSSAEG